MDDTSHGQTRYRRLVDLCSYCLKQAACTLGFPEEKTTTLGEQWQPLATAIINLGSPITITVFLGKDRANHYIS